MTETNHLTALKAKHAALDDAIKEEMARPLPDEAAISNLKRQKLKLKEEIAAEEGANCVIGLVDLKPPEKFFR